MSQRAANPSQDSERALGWERVKDEPHGLSESLLIEPVCGSMHEDLDMGMALHGAVASQEATEKLSAGTRAGQSSAGLGDTMSSSNCGQSASSSGQARSMSLAEARALAETNITPGQLLDVLANLGSNENTDAPQSREATVPSSSDPALPTPALPTSIAGTPTHAGAESSAAAMHSRSAVRIEQSALETELSMPSPEPGRPEESSLISPSQQDWPYVEDDIAGPTGLERQLQEAHLDVDVDWDKLATTVTQQMEHHSL